MNMHERIMAGKLFTDMCEGMPEERDEAKKRMIAFNLTTPDTLEERLSEHGFIQQGFRIKDMDGNYIWKQVRITRAPSVEEKTYIYTIQAMSSVSARIAEMLVKEHPEMLE